MSQKRIAIDFDGVIVEHSKPLGGELNPVPGALAGLHTLQETGWKIFLWTARSGDLLDQAVKYLEDNGIELMCDPNVMKGQHHWTDSPKAHCELYIDDRGVGMPLNHFVSGKRSYVCWAGWGGEEGDLLQMIEDHYELVERK